MNEALLVLAPHPDDEILGAGGIMARAHSRGQRIGVIVLTDGTRSDPDMCPLELREIRASECQSGLETMLGEVPPLLMLSYRDGELDSRTPDLTEASALGQFLRGINAMTIMVTDPGDGHRDHKAAFGLACRIVAEGLARRLVVLPVSQRIDHQFSGNGFDPLPVSEFAATKMAAINRHESQISASRDSFALSQEVRDDFSDCEYMREVFAHDNPTKRPQTIPADHFDGLFERNQDPWNYQNSPYEMDRFSRTLNVLRSRWHTNTLELGCANGVLTRMLAAHSANLLAIDSSVMALNVARMRTGGASNIELRLGSLPDDLPDGEFDLIVLSDFLYYLGFSGCVTLARRMPAIAAPGCRIVIANYLGETECALTGEMAAELMIAHLPDWKIVAHDRCDRLRIDVLELE